MISASHLASTVGSVQSTHPFPNPISTRDAVPALLVASALADFARTTTGRNRVACDFRFRETNARAPSAAFSPRRRAQLHQYNFFGVVPARSPNAVAVSPLAFHSFTRFAHSARFAMPGTLPVFSPFRQLRYIGRLPINCTTRPDYMGGSRTTCD
jgi:hypothetical protein